jgi:hypothetical protein
MRTVWQQIDLLEVGCELVHQSGHLFQLGCPPIDISPSVRDLCNNRSSNLPAPVGSAEATDTDDRGLALDDMVEVEQSIRISWASTVGRCCRCSCGQEIALSRRVRSADADAGAQLGRLFYCSRTRLVSCTVGKMLLYTAVSSRLVSSRLVSCAQSGCGSCCSCAGSSRTADPRAGAALSTKCVLCMPPKCAKYNGGSTEISGVQSIVGGVLGVRLG